MKRNIFKRLMSKSPLAYVNTKFSKETSLRDRVSLFSSAESPCTIGAKTSLKRSLLSILLICEVMMGSEIIDLDVNGTKVPLIFRYWWGSSGRFCPAIDQSQLILVAAFFAIVGMWQV